MDSSRVDRVSQNNTEDEGAIERDKRYGAHQEAVQQAEVAHLPERGEEHDEHKELADNKYVRHRLKDRVLWRRMSGNEEGDDREATMADIIKNIGEPHGAHERCRAIADTRCDFKRGEAETQDPKNDRLDQDKTQHRERADN